MDPSLMTQLRAAVADAGQILDQAAYRQAKALFSAALADVRGEEGLAALSKEYPKAEYLAALTEAGGIAPLGREIVEDFCETIAQQPGFSRWFQPANPTGGEPILLPARWLCHLAGIRHPTVQLFIDHPTLAGHTLVQVRGLNRTVSPGRFDSAVAGHATGLMPLEEALYRELGEELGLGPDDIEEMACLGSYNYPEVGPEMLDFERRIVFRGRLAPGGLARVHFADAEVAAIAIFAVPELVTLVEHFPERVASGLRGSLPLYLAA